MQIRTLLDYSLLDFVASLKKEDAISQCNVIFYDCILILLTSSPNGRCKGITARYLEGIIFYVQEKQVSNLPFPSRAWNTCPVTVVRCPSTGAGAGQNPEVVKTLTSKVKLDKRRVRVSHRKLSLVLGLPQLLLIQNSTNENQNGPVSTDASSPSP